MRAELPPEDRLRLQELFDRAADLPQEEHAAFVERECGTNAALRGELERLLARISGEDHLARIHPAPPARLGTRIGPYELREKIGEGGMGEVYAAEQLTPVARRVALKIIRPGMASAQVSARFDVERQVLARMSHANIAQVFDGGTSEDGLPYFVMEYVAGEPITEYCDRRKLSTRERLELFVSVCEGVQHAHQKGIIHRDLKPSNLLVMEQDGRAVPKIIDFGVARATSGSPHERTLQTMLGQVVGTLDYMSPEQADPTALEVDTRSDIYSLGVLLYQLVSGLLPFEHQLSPEVPLSEVQRVIREQDPPTPSTRLRRKKDTATTLAPLHGTDQRSLVRQLSGDLDWICLKALEKDPARRYASASELAADLHRHLEHRPVLAGRPGALYRASKFVRRNRVRVTAGVLVAGALSVGVVGIVAGRLEAHASERFARAALDADSVVGLEEATDELWPPYPERIEDLNYWMMRAQKIVDQLPKYREMLEEGGRESRQIEAIAKAIKGGERLESGLLAQDATTQEHGWSVPKRLEFARSLERGFAKGGEYAEAWARALPEIRTAYPGLDLNPQMGLLPLGADKESHLWEFAHLMTGEPAVRGADGKIEVTGDMGVVLVLIPGGTFTMGAQWEDEQGENYDPYSKDATSGDPEGPLVSVTLEPFFLSKFEMTQGQWERTMGSNPSASGLLFDVKLSSDNPVNSVDWSECHQSVSRIGLALPSEEQWEYAARAMTSTIWSTGDEPNSLQGHANVRDKSTKRKGLNTPFNRGPDASFDDKHATIAPVGSFDPNPWGLHDVHGNVVEFCSNGPYVYGNPPTDPEIVDIFVCRGGSNRATVFYARSAFRQNFSVGLKYSAMGLRPMRTIEP